MVDAIVSYTDVTSGDLVGERMEVLERENGDLVMGMERGREREILERESEDVVSIFLK